MNFEIEMTAIVSVNRIAWTALAVLLGVGTAGCKGQPPAPANVAVVKGVTAAATAPMCGGVDVHTKHIDLAVGCITCHPCGAVFGFDVPYTFPRGTTTAGGTITRGTPPVATTCSVGCHSPMGAPPKTVAWNAGPRDCLDCHVTSTLPATHPVIANPAPTGADCLACHDMSKHTSGTVLAGGHPAVGTALTGCATCHPQTMTAAGVLIAPTAGGKHLDGIIEASGGAGGHGASWLDTTSAGFHAYSAIADLSSCQGCHGANLDGVGGSATTSCTTCHGAGWQSNCTLCHGGLVETSGAPPKGTWGFRTDLGRIGAHTKHVTAGAISAAVPCATCHVVPANATTPGHMNGSAATVTWGGIAATGGAAPTWNRGTLTCSSTYCHGGYSGTFVYDFWGPAQVAYAGSNATPKWTDGPMTCTSCHANPPRNGNWHDPSHGGGSNCNLCHPNVNATGTAILNPALHINGVVDVQATYKSSCFGCH
jgi:predicted CxxxxCH...CXXCH cytochrome family protein